MRSSVTVTAVCAWVLAALAGGVHADTATYQVAASADDTVATSYNNYCGIGYVYWPDKDTGYWGYLRWAVDIPAGSTITEAHVSVRAYSDFSTTTTARMQLLDYDNCPSFSSNPYSLSVTAGYVDWTAGAWTNSQWYDSADIKDLVQAFIDRPGYSPGNYLGLRSLTPSGTAQKRVCSWDYSGNIYGAKLVVTYTAYNEPPVADAGEEQTVTDTGNDGYETVTLDGSGSSDSDGTIASYVWQEGASQIATGQTANVSLSVGTHTITLTVTDDDSDTDEDTVTIVVNPTYVPHTAMHQTEVSKDDTYATSTSSNYTATIAYWPYTTTARLPFTRFSLNVPPGATITSACLKLRSTGQKGGASVSTVRLQLVDSDDCPEFDVNPFDYDVTTNYVDWQVPADWTADEWYSSPDISSIVQEFIDRPGYEFTNYIGIRGIWTAGPYKSAYQWDYGDHTSGPVLEVTYEGGSTMMALWMADPEVRIGQKVYCQLFNAQPSYSLRARLGGNVFYTKSGPLAAEEVVTTDYRSLQSGQHTLLIEILDAANQVQASAGRTWTKLHNGIGKYSIDENNAICCYGEPFFPFFGLGMDLGDNYRSGLETFQGSVNSVFGQGWNRALNVGGWSGYLDDMAVQGLPTSGPLNGNFWPGGHTAYKWEDPPGTIVYAGEADIDAIEDYIEATKDKPALFMWCWKDEPDMGPEYGYIPATEVHEWTQVCHSLDTEHPHMTTLIGYGFGGPDGGYNQHRIQSYCFMYNDRKTSAMGDNEPFADRTVVADVMGFDYYPYEYATKYTWSSLENYALAVDRLIEWNYNLIPCISWIETCDIWSDPPPDGYTWTPAITDTQLHNLIWLTIIHGAKGIGWFHYFQPTSAANKQVMADAIELANELAPVILGPQEVSVAVTEQELGDERVDIMTRECDGVLFIFAAHLIESGQGETVRFNVEGLQSGQMVVAYGEGRTITSQSGCFDDTFAPLDVHIYMVSLSGSWSPLAGAGDSEIVHDTDLSGYETVTLDGSGSVDYDGTIVSYVWKEGATTIANGETANVSLAVGMHTITLVVTDNESNTDSDIVQIVVNDPPVADAGEDQNVNDTDGNDYETVTLDGTDSSDSDGTIVSYVWSEDAMEIATGETASVDLAVGTHTVTLVVTDSDGGTSSDDVVVTVTSPYGTHVQYQIAASADDTLAQTNNNYYAIAYTYWPHTETGYRSFLRWAIDVPAGSTITKAHLWVRAYGDYGTSPTIRMQLVDSDDCPGFSSNPYSWSVTAGYVDWATSTWTNGQWYQSPDIKTLVQAFVDRAGYGSGSYLGLRGANPSGTDYKRACSWDFDDNTSGAVLDIHYTTP